MRSYELKLARAEYHISEAKRVFSDWLSHGYRVFEQPNSQGRFELMAEMLEDLPNEIGLIIGDAFHCLRDCLDHLVFDLSAQNGTLSSYDEREIMFPIPDRKAIELTDRRINKISDIRKTAIIGLLPDPTRNDFNRHPLAILNKMNNRDKHRKISMVCATSAINKFALFASDGSDYFHIIGPAKPKPGGPPVKFLEFARSKNVKTEIGFTTQIIFDEGTEVSGQSIFTVLDNICDYVRNTVIKTLI